MIRAVILDMDGTLVDNIPYHRSSWFSFLRHHGIHVDEANFDAINHGTIDEMIIKLFGSHLPPERIRQLGLEKEEQYRRECAPFLIEVDGLRDALEWMKLAGVKIGLATNGNRDNISFVLDGLSIRSFFDVVVSGDDVQKGKPDPEIYLLAARQLGLSVGQCAVVEDSLGGVRAGRDAGMKVIGITTSLNAEDLMAAGCSMTMDHFLDFSGTLEQVFREL